ncbi:MAG: hypothetical protein ACYC2K_15750 [Gemmatimonadales bacterium]
MANVDVGLGRDSAQPQTVHAGVNQIVCRISLSATTSVGDVLRIGKLPNGVIPTDSVFYPGPAFAAGIWKFGWSASQAAFIASATLSVTTRGNVPLTANISLSDDARVLYEPIVGVPAAVVTVGFQGNLVVSYILPGQTV